MTETDHPLTVFQELGERIEDTGVLESLGIVFAKRDPYTRMAFRAATQMFMKVCLCKLFALACKHTLSLFPTGHIVKRLSR